MNFIIRLLITSAVAYGLSTVLSGVHMTDFKEAFIFVLILGLLNAFLKPLLVILTLPITVFTLGLFLFVINTAMIMLADHFLDGIRIDGFWWALIFSLCLSFVSSFAYSLVEQKKD